MKQMQRLFVTGIGTGIGKTVVSAILVRALQADYWKPIQCGSLGHTDTDQVREWVGNTSGGLVFHPETYRLKDPLPPHAAAENENLTIDLHKIRSSVGREGIL